jgi:hypothetical protein
MNDMFALVELAILVGYGPGGEFHGSSLESSEKVCDSLNVPQIDGGVELFTTSGSFYSGGFVSVRGFSPQIPVKGVDVNGVENKFIVSARELFHTVEHLQHNCCVDFDHFRFSIRPSYGLFRPAGSQYRKGFGLGGYPTPLAVMFQ